MCSHGISLMETLDAFCKKNFPNRYVLQENLRFSLQRSFYIKPLPNIKLKRFYQNKFYQFLLLLMWLLLFFAPLFPTKPKVLVRYLLYMWRSKRKQVHKPFSVKNTVICPGFTGRFTEIYREVHRDVLGSSLRFTRKIPGIWVSLLGKSREVPVSLPVKARDLPGYCDELPGISPVNFQFPGKSLYLFSLGTLHI